MARVQLDDFETVTQVRVQWSDRFGIGESDFSFLLPAAAGDRFTRVSDAFNLWLMPKFRAQRSSAWAVNKIIIHDLWPGIEGDSVTDVNLGGLPEDAGIGIPPQLTPLISWRTGETGRNNRGRTYMGTYLASSIIYDGIQDPALSAVYDFAETMLLHFTGSIGVDQPRFVIYSKWQDGDPVYPPFYSPVLTYFFQGRWAIQRRRLDWDWRT